MYRIKYFIDTNKFCINYYSVLLLICQYIIVIFLKNKVTVQPISEPLQNKRVQMVCLNSFTKTFSQKRIKL